MIKSSERYIDWKCNFIWWSISIKAEGSTAKINILVKPRDSNDVLSQNTNDFSKNSWDYEKNSIYGVHVKDSDYSFGVVPVPQTHGNQFQHNNDPNLHMRFNEVEGETFISVEKWNYGNLFVISYVKKYLFLLVRLKSRNLLRQRITVDFKRFCDKVTIVCHFIWNIISFLYQYKPLLN